MEAPPRPRSPWQRLYAALHRHRARYWSRRAGRLPRPVVSLGNLHWGGTGKTPLVAALASRLGRHGRRVAVLSRGYGRRGGADPLLVSRGGGPLVDPWTAGDEAFLLAEQLPGAAVVVAADRYTGGRFALEQIQPPPDLFLLDDGFSHLRLARDLDLLAIPGVDPFGAGRLPPSGRLREPLESSARADALLITGEVPPPSAREVQTAFRGYGFAGPAFAAPTRVGAPRFPDGRELAPGIPVLLVTGVARAERVRTSAGRLGFEVRDHLALPDHHPYPPRTLRRVRRRFARSGATVVLTTTKDRPKLVDRLELPVAELPVAAEPEAAAWQWLDQALDRLEVSRS